jgi:hypothetical protein
MARRVSVEVVDDAAAARAGRPDDWSKRAVAWVERACAEQGVPVKLTDPLALQHIADILGEARDAREKGARQSSQAA